MSEAKSTRSIGAFRALQLGDLLCAIPAIRALKRSNSDARLTLIGLPWARELVERYSDYLDEFLEFPGWPGIAERDPDPDRAREYQREAEARHFDLVVQMHGDGRTSNSFVTATPASTRAGFVPDEASVEPGFIPYPRELPEVYRLLALAEHLGATDLDPELEFPLSEGERSAAAQLLIATGVDTSAPYACIHAGGRGADRRWRADGFAAVADSLARAGYQVILTGSEIDRPVNEQVSSLATAPVIDLTAKTTIATLAATIEGASFLVTNDSAPSHLAAAVRTPSLVIFTGSDRARWAPANSRLHRGIGAGRPDGGPPAPPPPVEEVLAALPAGPGTDLSAR